MKIIITTALCPHHVMSTVQLITNILVLQTFYTGYGPAKKKKPEDPDRLTLTRELHSVKKDLEAARRANVKLEKELAEKEKEKAREASKVETHKVLLILINFCICRQGVTRANSRRQRGKTVMRPLSCRR